MDSEQEAQEQAQLEEKWLKQLTTTPSDKKRTVSFTLCAKNKEKE
jgi:hypothetical protein